MKKFTTLCLIALLALTALQLGKAGFKGHPDPLGGSRGFFKMMTGNRGRKNFSSVRDIGHLLTRMYYRELVAEEEDSIMLDILLEQNDKECFPKALPAYKIAHKTGEIDGVFADGGIFFGPQGTFILVAINEHYAERMDAITKMQKLAQYYAGTLGE